MTATPKVTVIVPTYNRAYCLGDTLRTVLAQSFTDFELIVVDDGSTDGTQEMVAAQFQDARLRYVRQNNGGVSAARNTGMELAKGVYIAFCDSDDLWDPWKLEVQVAAMDRFPAAGICWTDLAAVAPDLELLHARYTRIAYRTWERKPIGELFESNCTLAEIDGSLEASLGAQRVYCGNIFSTMIAGTIINMPTVMVRRSVSEAAGRFDKTMIAGEDYDFNLRLCALAPAVFVDAVTIKYRIGAADQLTRPELMIEQARNSLRTILPFLRDRRAQIDFPEKEISRILAGRYHWLGESELEAGNRSAARAALFKSLTYRLAQPRTAVLAFSTLLPPLFIQTLRRAYQLAKSSP